MIPKIIHYVWLGSNAIPANLQSYIDGWHRLMSESDGWHYMLWTEKSIADYCTKASCLSPFAISPYCQQAYDAGKFAFASDYIRLWALEQFGGIYLDTDVEVLRSIDELLEFNQQSAISNQQYSAFIGFEESLAQLPGTCVMGCEAHCLWVKEMLATYDGAEFIKKTETKNQKPEFDLTTNVHRLGECMVAGGLIPNGKEQFIAKWGLHVYDFHYFSPLTSTRVMRKTRDTFTIHHFAASWQDKNNGNWLKVIGEWTITREITNVLIQVKRFIKRYV